MGRWLEKFKNLFRRHKQKPQSEEGSFWNKTEVNIEPLSDPKIFFARCGHMGPSKAKITIWSRIFPLELKKDKLITTQGEKTANAHCPNCLFCDLKEHAIRCCFCGGAIIPGEGVALYNKNSADVNKEAATYVEDNVIGCLGWNCCPCGAFFAGHWTKDGFRPAFEHGLNVAEEAMATGQGVIVSNTDDPSTISHAPELVITVDIPKKIDDK